PARDGEAAAGGAGARRDPARAGHRPRGADRLRRLGGGRGPRARAAEDARVGRVDRPQAWLSGARHSTVGPASSNRRNRRRPRAIGRRGMLLEGKRLLVTGVLTESSIAYAVAEGAQREGAEVVLTGFGRGLSITQRIARRLPREPEVLELD